MQPRTLAGLVVLTLVAFVPSCATPATAAAAHATSPSTITVRTTAGTEIEGTLAAGTPTLRFTIGAGTREIAVQDLLSVHRAATASPAEAAQIAKDLPLLAGSDRAAAEAATAELTDLGLPVLTPLLDSYADTDAHEPDARYRLFARLVPGHADGPDRTLDLIRLADGTVLRGLWQATDLDVTGTDGTLTKIPAAAVRRLAVRRDTVERTFELHALHHCTYVAFLDTGIAVTPTTALRADAEGFVRLSFAEDGWAADPDGIHDPLPGKRKLQEGFRWGAVLGRVGPSGDRWFAGRHCAKQDLGRGRLYFVVNDNEHWQNNIGSFRMKVQASHAYDLGEPQ